MYNINSEYKNFKFNKIKSGASKKIFYRLQKDNKSFILTDFNLDKKEYLNHLKIYNILKDLDISIPEIYESNDTDLFTISEDFGNLRFDKIINKEPIDKLLFHAVDSLKVINQSLQFNSDLNLPIYNYKNFEDEIMELPKYFLPYLYNNVNENVSEEYLLIWSEYFNKFDFDFSNFVHKDFNINNLILLPSKKNHLKCGIIDFQSAFWGESCWDLFSLLEDSRIFFTDEFNDHFIEHFFDKTEHNLSMKEYKMKYHFLNCSRQSRLLGRWVKLSKNLGEKWYLDFIPVTKKRMLKSINFLNNKSLNNFYYKYIFDNEF